MKEVPNKVTGSSYTADEFTNGIKTELQSIVSNTDQAFDELNQNQLMQALIRIGSTASSYNDTGGANAYQLSPTNPFTSNVLTDYFDGLTVNFVAANVNTGASTAQIAGLGPVPIKDIYGNDIAVGSLQPNALTTLIYQVGAPDVWVWHQPPFAPFAEAMVDSTGALVGTPYNIVSTSVPSPNTVNFVFDNPAPWTPYTVYISREDDPSVSHIVSQQGEFLLAPSFSVFFSVGDGSAAAQLPTARFAVRVHRSYA